MTSLYHTRESAFPPIELLSQQNGRIRLNWKSIRSIDSSNRIEEIHPLAKFLSLALSLLLHNSLFPIAFCEKNQSQKGV